MIFLSILCLECLWEHEDFMKKKLFTLLLSAAAVALICNCGDDAVINPDDNKNASTPIVSQPSFLYRDGDTNYIIDAYGFVTNEAGDTVALADIAGGLIVALDSERTIIAQGINFADLELLEPTIITETSWVLRADKNYVIHPMNQYGIVIVTDGSGAAIGSMLFKTDSEGVPTTVGDILDLEGNVLVSNVDLNDLTIYQPNVHTTPTPIPVPGISSSSNGNPGPGPVLTSSSSVVNPGNSSSSKTNSSSSNAKSSSSSAKSSSSSAKSSSSSAKSSSSQSQGSNYVIKYVNGGKSGEGYATRYWDCCKPHCAWPEHGGSATTCDAQGNKIGDKSAGSMCDGGNAGICRSQFPIIINDTLAFAFAATPGGENNCGKCFDLVFQGKGKYSNDRQAKIKGKHLIVMSNNVGYDVAGGQFDVMIPGGGYGIFNGCGGKMGWGSQGSQYGGLLDECEKETNYNANKYQSCLTEKCNKSFSSDPEAKEGCLFLATWMNAAGNPLLTYKEVECPKELKDRY